MNQILKLLKTNNIKSLFSTVFSFLSNILFMAILLRSLSKHDFAEWMFFFTCFSLLESFRYGSFGFALIHKVAGISVKEKKESVIGSGWALGIITTTIVVTCCYLILFLFYNQAHSSNFFLFLKWYPLLAVLTLPSSVSLALLEAEQNFSKVFLIRTLKGAALLLFLLGALYMMKLSAEHVIIIFILVNALISLICIIWKWSGIGHLIKSQITLIKELFNFGKYTLGTSIASNLLQNSDVLIIYIFLTNSDLAIYSVPLKVIDGMHVVLTSFTAVAFPLLSSARKSKNFRRIRKLFYSYSGTMTLLFLPGIILLFIFSSQVIWILAGKDYIADVRAEYILRLFLLYGLFLSIDRFTGVTLDSINKPKLNSLKVYIMLTFNIIGDLIAVIVYKSIVLAAAVTILNGFLGLFLGLIFLNKYVKINPGRILYSGFHTIRFNLKLDKLKQ